MFLESLKPAIGATKKRKRVGRGPGSGHGKTSCRGEKGQKSRSGCKRNPGFEGGQMPLHRRLPKRGFINIFRKKWTIVNIGVLSCFKDGEEVTPDALFNKRIIKSTKVPLRILGKGGLKKSLNIKAHHFSASAIEAIERAKGTATVIEK